MASAVGGSAIIAPSAASTWASSPVGDSDADADAAGTTTGFASSSARLELAGCARMTGETAAEAGTEADAATARSLAEPPCSKDTRDLFRGLSSSSLTPPAPFISAALGSARTWASASTALRTRVAGELGWLCVESMAAASVSIAARNWVGEEVAVDVPRIAGMRARAEQEQVRES